MGLLRDLTLWFWHLLPGNPILVRVVSTGGKRQRHLWARLAYLLALVIVFLIGGGLLLGESGALNDLAKKATRTFVWVSMVQLLLMSFVAPVFCAGAITQEKDANTYHILLTTPLTNGQIVLGSLFSRLFFVWALLLSGLPIFCITMIYGGVTTAEIFQSFGLAACTGLITGSTAIMISFLRVGTRRTIFSFFAGVAIYLLGIGLLGFTPWGQLPPEVAPVSKAFFTTGQQFTMSWLAPLHPFLALFVVTGQTPAPPFSDLAQYGSLSRWLLAYPHYGYMLLTTLASLVMIAVSLIYVRRGAREGEATITSRIADVLMPRRAGPGSRKPRRVWRNPIAWREASTRGSAGGRSALRWVFIAAGVITGFVILLAHHNHWWGFNPRPPAIPDIGLTRDWLIALVWIEMAVILLVVTNTAATTLTREKEAFTMELLLSTPLTSRYIIAGMLQGLVRLVIPLIAVPTLTIALFVLFDLLDPSPAGPVTAPEALLLVPALMTAFAALAAMIGLHFSLLSRKTVQAVMLSTAVVLGAAGLLTLCGYALRGSNASLSAVIFPFTPFPAMESLLDPWREVERTVLDAARRPAAVVQFRLTRAIFTAASAVGFLAITYALYKSMVRGFDMTVRRQSA